MENKNENYWSQKAAEARRISEGMRKLNPELYNAAEAVVKKRIKVVKEIILSKIN